MMRLICNWTTSEHYGKQCSLIGSTLLVFHIFKHSSFIKGLFVKLIMNEFCHFIDYIKHSIKRLYVYSLVCIEKRIIVDQHNLDGKCTRGYRKNEIVFVILIHMYQPLFKNTVTEKTVFSVSD